MSNKIPNLDQDREHVYGSDLFVELLKAYNIEYVSANIGATFRSIWESMVNLRKMDLKNDDNSFPEAITACHEEIAVAMAHGYAKATGKPMAVLLHDLVGLQHATMAIYNAWVDRVPILLIGAEGPMDLNNRRPWIDWIHTANIPNQLIREYVKWDDFPWTIESVPESFARAYNTAISKPYGPVYICLDSGYLEKKTITIDLKKYKEDHPSPMRIEAGYSTVQKLAKDILGAKYPVILAGSVGKLHPESVQELVQLAETTGAAVIDLGDCFSFPNNHPQDLTMGKIDALHSADLVLALEVNNLEQALTSTDKQTREIKNLLSTEAKVITVGLNDLTQRGWAADFQRLYPVNYSIQADSSTLISSLTQISVKLIEKSVETSKSLISERKVRLSKQHGAIMKKILEDSKKGWNDVPISLPRLAYEIWESVKEYDWVLAGGSLHSGPLDGWCRRLWAFEKPGCFLGTSGAGGLGYGLPSSMGVALAYRKDPKKLVINIQSDGDMLFTPSALWTAAHYRLPLLIVMFNNRSYYNDAEHNRLMAMERGRDGELAFSIGGDITDPEIDFGKMAQSYGMYGSGPVTSPAEIRNAVEEAINVVVKERKPALVDVITKHR
jgi:thiamine pyrophosphate-dependent acetolactate synthase large subunit-like protein